MTVLKPTEREKKIFGANGEIVSRDADKSVCRIKDADGAVIMTLYSVFPGIDLIYKDIHAKSFTIEQKDAEDILEIDHCREGRTEFKYGNSSVFLGPGDLLVSKKNMTVGRANYPLMHYHGISVLIDVSKAPACLNCLLSDVEVVPKALEEKFCDDQSFYFSHSSAAIEHVFSELYNVPETIRKGYFKVKILELLLFLSALKTGANRRAYTETQVQLANRIGAFLAQNTEGKTSIAELSAKFGASPSLINNSFRGVYGMTPAAFLRAQKMRDAAAMLRETDFTVLDIAGRFGYDNASKFAKAFKSIIGVAPNAYRNGVDVDSCAPGTDKA